MLAAFVALVVAAPAFAATITVTPPTGVDASATNTYTIYKVFDAVVSPTDPTKVSYTLPEGKTLTPAMEAAGFSVDTAGNVSGPSGTELSADAIAAITAFVAGDTAVGTITTTGTTAAASANLPAGYYFITTSTGTVVTIDTNNAAENVDVNDKNTVPSVDKKITGANSIDEDGKKALAQVGTTVNYSAEITIGQGAKGYIFHDTMETGLTYNNDAKVSYGGAEVTAANHFTLGKVGDDTFTITFDDTYIKTLTVGQKITVTYSATVNDDAITTDPLNNTCYVSYGDKNSNNKTPESEADVYEAKITVTKKDGENKPLAGAGFVISRASGSEVPNPDYDADAAAAAEAAGETYDVPATITTTTTEYYKITGKVVSWVTDIEQATEYTSNDQGEIQAFTGLANGTYTLIEKTVPAGYNKAADINFTIAEHDYTAENLEQTAEVTNRKGQELPSTGGMGTTILYTIGGIMLVGGAIALVSKKRVANMEK